MQNTELSEAQAGKRLPGEISITSNNAYDTTLMAESKEELKSLWMKMKEESEKVGSKLNIQKMKIMESIIHSHHFMATRWGNSGNSG